MYKNVFLDVLHTMIMLIEIKNWNKEKNIIIKTEKKLMI